MNGADDFRRENEMLRGRISRLSAAILRINASLDLDTVLHEVRNEAFQFPSGHPSDALPFDSLPEAPGNEELL